ncbi:hydroxymethylbilane synthase [Lentilitoribacter sp. Alg239-R112]|uniref:hydroxymethylbilane synthase n=1 Tax=Lentilitoribacter sp. Alg239-R112 TaxID=2305987 RepID=UPI0013A6E884|nr:hydroxymethylbilane synthase [Lentilitoribacter sp. Alg239-R112]
MQTKPYKIGTRGGALALIQAEDVRKKLMLAHDLPESAFEIVILSTKADRMTNQPLSEIGGKGLFTLELEEKLIDGSLDFAVHCVKDMATKLPEGLYLSAYLEREDPRDVLIGGAANTISELPENALIGTSSLRRQALIRRIRPDLRVTLFRGLVGTRLQKLADGEVDATLLALAGLKRLKIEDKATEILEIDTFLPAPGQGAICIESKIGNSEIDELIAPLNDPTTETCILCERAFLRALDGSCRTPIAGHAQLVDQKIHFSGKILNDDGSLVYETQVTGNANDADTIGKDEGETLRAQAGDNFFKDWT